ncbi:MAG: type II toxin-antitoxin system BrnA family antitoxin [Desulfopila sp.]
MKAKQFDEKFESGEDLTDDLDFSKARRVNQEAKRVNIDFPAWVVKDLDKHSKRLGITRQALVKVWIAEKLKEAVLP